MRGPQGVAEEPPWRGGAAGTTFAAAVYVYVNMVGRLTIQMVKEKIREKRKRTPVVKRHSLANGKEPSRSSGERMRVSGGRGRDCERWRREMGERRMEMGRRRRGMRYVL